MPVSRFSDPALARDSRRVRVYTPRVPVEPAPQQPPPLGDHGTTTRRRRLPNPAEQERRKAWAEEWGKVGKDWKARQLAKERA